jgi:hypothetical protein
MKIIKSFLLLTVCLSATTWLRAQEVKTEVLMKTEVKAPPMAVKNNTPSPAPELIPMNGVIAKEALVAAAETPSPFKKDENKKQPEAPKTQILTIDANAATNKLTTEQLKTLNGTAKKPKQLSATPVSDTPGATQQPVSKPVIAKTPGNK